MLKDLLKISDDVIFVRNKNDVLKAAELLESIGIPVFTSPQVKEEWKTTDKEVTNNYMIQNPDRSWRIQSHYLGNGTPIDELEAAVNNFKGVVPVIVKDIEGHLLEIGNVVYYSTKMGVGNATTILVKAKVTKITDKGNVKMEGDRKTYLSTQPERQILKIQ